MHRSVVAAALVLAAALPASRAAAHGQPRVPPLRVAASSFASVEVHLNPRRIGQQWYEESLTIYLVPDAPRPGSGSAELQGRLRVVWGTTERSTTWRMVP